MTMEQPLTLPHTITNYPLDILMSSFLLAFLSCYSLTRPETPPSNISPNYYESLYVFFGTGGIFMEHLCWYVCEYKLEDAQKDSNSNSTSGLTLSQSKQGERTRPDS